MYAQARVAGMARHGRRRGRRLAPGLSIDSSSTTTTTTATTTTTTTTIIIIAILLLIIKTMHSQ